jgi:nitrogen fixation protein
MIQLTDNLEINKPAPVDDRLGVFESTAEALAYINEDRRYIGLTIIVDNGTGAHEYWFKDGVTDSDLIVKSEGGGTAWGTITGTLSNQTDLQTALNAKANTSSLATVATSGSYNDLTNKPTIPSAQVNSDWNSTSGVSQILNKPTIPSIDGLVPYTGASGNVDLGTYNLTADKLALNVSPTGTLAVGMTEWNDSIGSSQTLLKGGSVTLKNGVDLVARVVNKVSPNTTLTKASYQVVKVSGAQGQRLAVNLAQANTDLNSADTLGVVTETIAPNQEGFILTVGQLQGVNTTGSLQGETWADGDVLYLSPTTAGRMTNVKPNGSTGHIVVLGYVEYSHAINGKIYVKIMNGWELDELHNVYINPSTLANNDALVYESSTDLWKNKQVTKSMVGLGNVDNTSDANKPVSTATQTALNAKEDTITAGTTSQYYRGDKTFQTLDKTAVGLGNVDNTSDANKPISTATQTALNRITSLFQDVSQLSTTSTTAVTLTTFTVASTNIPVGGVIRISGVIERTAGTGNTTVGINVNSGGARYLQSSGTNSQFEILVCKTTSTNVRYGLGASNTTGNSFSGHNSTTISVAQDGSGNFAIAFLGLVGTAGATLTVQFVKGNLL